MTQFYRVKNMEGAGPLRTASGRKYFVVLIDRNNAILDQNGFVRLLYLDQEEYKEKPLNLILAPRSENQA